MSPILDAARWRRLLLLLLIPLWSCADGASAPDDFEFGSTVSVALQVVFPGGESSPPAMGVMASEGPAAVAGEARPINRIRVRAFEEPGRIPVGSALLDVSPDDPSWEVPVALEVPTGAGIQVLFEIELINVDANGRETVQWSGRAGPLTVTTAGAGRIEQIQVFRGPLDNLLVTGLEIDNEGPVAEGATRQLTTTIATTGSTPSVAWASSDNGIATVSGTGLVTGVTPGVVNITATAGPASDTEQIEVTPVGAGLQITPAEQTVGAIGANATFTAALVDARGQTVSGGGPFAWRSLNQGVARHLGDGVFEAVGGGQAIVEVTSASRPELNAATALLNVVLPAIDLSVTKTAEPTTVAPGEAITWTITVQNGGPSTAADVVVADVLGTGHTLAGVAPGSPSQGTVTGVTASGATWDVGSLASGASATLLVETVVQPNAGATVTNTAQARDRRGAPDGNQDDNSVVTAVDVVRTDADLAVTKVASSNIGVVGGAIQFDITVTNNGPADATGVVVTENPDIGITFTDASFDVGAVNLGTGDWTVGTLAAGQSATLTLTAELAGTVGQTLLNRVSVAGDGSNPDPVADNNEAEVLIALADRQADIEVITEVDYCANLSPPAFGVEGDSGKRQERTRRSTGTGENDTRFDQYYYCYGAVSGDFDRFDEVNFRVIVVNNGPDASDGARISGTPSTGYQIEDAATNRGSVDEQAQLWTTAPLAPEGADTLFVMGFADETSSGRILSFTASLTEQLGAVDLNPENDTSTASGEVTEAFADVGLTKEVITNPSPAPGEQVVYRITADNFDYDDAYSVQIGDVIDAGATLVSGVPSAGTFDPATGIWVIDVLGAFSSETLDVTAQMPNVETTVTNSVSVVGPRLETDLNDENDEAEAVVLVSLGLGAAIDIQTIGNTPLLSPGYPTTEGPEIVSDSNLFGGATVALTAGSCDGALGTLDVEADGEFKFTPFANEAGSETIVCILGPDTVSVNVSVEEMVWYVNNEALGPGDGTAEDPFTTLAAAEAAMGNDDYVYLQVGDGTTTGYDQGISLQEGSSLVGEGCGLFFEIGSGISIVGSGRPHITNSTPGGAAIDLASGSYVCGVDISPMGGIGIRGSGIDGSDVSDVTMTSVRDGVWLDGSTGIFSFFGMQIDSDSDAPSDAAVRVTGADDAFDLDFDGAVNVYDGYLLEVANTTASNVSLTGGPYQIQEPDTAVRISNASFGPGAGVFMSSLTTLGGGIPSQGLYVGDSNTFVDINDADMNDIGTGVTLDGGSPAVYVTWSPSSLTAVSRLVDIFGVTGGVTFLDGGPMSAPSGADFRVASASSTELFVNSDVTMTDGIFDFSGFVGEATFGGDILLEFASTDFNGSSGTFSFDGGVTMDDATLDFDGFAGEATFSGSVLSTWSEGGTALRGDGGTVNFTGSGGFDISDGSVLTDGMDVSGTITGLLSGFPHGIQILNGPGTDVTFTDVEVGGFSQFAAFIENAGTVEFTGSNFIDTSVGGIRLVDTNIGPAGANFESINSSGGNTGISLDNVSGFFQVTGTGPANSGGTLSGHTGSSVILVDTDDVLLQDMLIQSPGGDGITGIRVSDMDLNRVTITGAGDTGIDLEDIGTGNNIDNSSITGSTSNNLFLSQVAGTGTLDVTSSSFSSSASGNGAMIMNSVSGTADVTFSGSILDGNSQIGLYGFNNASSGDLILDVTGAASTMNSNGTWGVRFGNSGGLGAGAAYGRIANATISNNATGAVLADNGAQSHLELTVENSTLTNSSPDTGTSGFENTVTDGLDAVFRLSNVAISNMGSPVFVRGISNTLASSLDVSVVNSDVTAIVGGSPPVFFDQAGGFGTMCTNVQGNTLTGISDAGAYFTAGGVIGVEGWDFSDITTTLAGLGNTLSPVSISNDASFADGTCLSPINPF